MRKIVITGIGVISPMGIGKERFWKSLCQGENLLSRSPNSSVAENSGRGLIRDFDELAYMDSKTSKYCQRAEKLALASSRLAFADAGLAPGNSPEMSLGVVIGSMTSNLRAAATFDQLVLRGEASFIDPSLIPSGIMNSLSGMVSIKNGIRGFHVPVAAGEASGAQAIQYALMQLENGRVDAALAGGVEEICEDLRLIDCVKNIPPARKKKEGNERSEGEKPPAFPLSEAAAILVLESASNAAQRGANTYAECVGFGSSYGPRSNTRRTAVRAAIRALEQACQGMESGSLDIDLIFASLNDSLAGDGIEMEALSQFFGYQMPEVACLKSLFGDSLGASGALQVAAAAMTIKESAKPLPANSKNTSLEAAFTLKDCVAKGVRQALVSSFSSDGHMSFLLLRESEE